MSNRGTVVGCGMRRLYLEPLENRLVLTAPVLVGVLPAANVQTAPTSAAVVATFDQPIDPATATDQSIIVHAGQRGKLSSPPNNVSTDGDQVTLTPANTFQPGELVQATLTTALENLTGEGLTNPFVWRFQTKVEEGTAYFTDSGQSLGNSYGQDVALGDLDGDGDIDAFVANGSWEPHVNNVWLNDGAGVFADSGQILGNAQSVSVVLGDVDSDGDLDAFVGHYGPAEIWLNNGSGMFSDSGQRIGTDAHRAALGDLNGDGHLDAAVTDTGRLEIWFNDGTGTFTTSGQTFGSRHRSGVELADLDRDGDVDAFVIGDSGARDEVWLNDGTGILTKTPQIFPEFSSLTLALGDINGDGSTDAVVGSNYSDKWSRVWLNDGAGIFTETGQVLSAGGITDVALGDLDGDDDLDLFTADFHWGEINVWLNDGLGSFDDSGRILDNYGSHAVALADLDADGDLDGFAASYWGSPNRVWLNGQLENLLLTVDIPIDTAGEEVGGVATLATVNRTGDTSIALPVFLESSDPTQVSVPPSVTIPAGATSAEFEVHVTNDPDLDGTKVATISARAASFLPAASDTLSVTDDDTPTRKTIGGRLTGSLASETYFALTEVIVADGAVLEFAPGSRVNFSPGAGITANGSLTAVGGATDRIVFTSSAANPAPGDWDGITAIGKNQVVLLQNVEISFATNGFTAGFVLGPDSEINIFDSTVSDNLKNGIMVVGQRGGTRHVPIANNQIFRNGGHGILISVSSSGGPSISSSANPYLIANEIFENQGSGIGIASSYHLGGGYINGAFASPTVDGNFIHHNQEEGIEGTVYAEPGSRGTAGLTGRYENNLVVENGSAGIEFTRSGEGHAKPTIANNTIVANNGAGIRYTDLNHLIVNGIINNNIVNNVRGIEFIAPLFDDATIAQNRVSANNVYGNTGGNWINALPEFGDLETANRNGTPADLAMNISVDPSFISASDFHLRPDSLLINAGTPNSAPFTDFDGDLRVPSLDAIDIGFDEVDFGLAPSDFDLDGDVDGNDFLIWQTGFGQFSDGSATRGDGDADNDGDVDGDDFLTWQMNFGSDLSSGSATTSPAGLGTNKGSRGALLNEGSTSPNISNDSVSKAIGLARSSVGNSQDNSMFSPTHTAFPRTPSSSSTS